MCRCLGRQGSLARRAREVLMERLAQREPRESAAPSGLLGLRERLGLWALSAPPGLTAHLEQKAHRGQLA